MNYSYSPLQPNNELQLEACSSGIHYLKQWISAWRAVVVISWRITNMTNRLSHVSRDGETTLSLNRKFAIIVVSLLPKDCSDR
ncbi:unnamed protein product [Litomosoides sigmodontis]|uniref:Uncharacterized protein n=1 Tax=Litomosoides sigmodontis TaxID=42156 RepID=A0A3P6TV21_LITSI|nr:unnamed protein product [Litomosoides sigmodontis]